MKIENPNVEKLSETWATLNGAAQEHYAMTTRTPTSEPPADLNTVVDVFQRWLYMPDPGALLMVLATLFANRLGGDPVWLLLVGPPGCGKTEILGSLAGLLGIHQAATLTEPALLSGSPKREQSQASTGGLLRAIGEQGLLICKDFGSVLSMRREDRASLLAALREVYDGSWTRQLGTDGGRTLSWSGKVGLLGGVTQAIDLHHAVMASLGERFLLYRIAEVDADDLADAALGSVGKEAMMRRELSAAVRSFCECAISPAPLLSPEDRRWLVNLSTLVSRCRSAVERDGYNREIELIPDAEMPGRLARTLAQLFAGLGALRVTSDERRRLIKKTALDCVPSTRRRTLQLLADNGGLLSTTAIASSLGYPSATARRALEDLAAHALVSRESGVRERLTRGA